MVDEAGLLATCYTPLDTFSVVGLQEISPRLEPLNLSKRSTMACIKLGQTAESRERLLPILTFVTGLVRTWSATGDTHSGASVVKFFLECYRARGRRARELPLPANSDQFTSELIHICNKTACARDFRLKIDICRSWSERGAFLQCGGKLDVQAVIINTFRSEREPVVPKGSQLTPLGDVPATAAERSQLATAKKSRSSPPSAPQAKSIATSGKPAITSIRPWMHAPWMPAMRHGRRRWHGPARHTEERPPTIGRCLLGA